jgi:hypothetical protein
MEQAARVMIGLEFERVALVPPEGDCTAPIVRLNEYFRDPFGFHDFFRFRWSLR